MRIWLALLVGLLFVGCEDIGFRKDLEELVFPHYEYSLQWGEYGTGDGQFDGPTGIAVDASGNVYVLDSGNYRIQKFDASGSYLTDWGRAGYYSDSIYGVAVDSAGNLHVLTTYEIIKYDSARRYLTKWAISGVSAFAVDSHGNVYASDWSYDRIQKFDASGTFLAKWGSNGSGDGQFSGPQGVAVDTTGDVYVADTLNYRLQKFDAAGAYILQWDPSDEVLPSNPSAIAVDAGGNILVAGSYGVRKYDGNGGLVTEFGSASGIGTGRGIAVDSTGTVYVSDPFGQRIEKLDSGGFFVLAWGRPGSGDGEFSSNSPQGVAVDPDGNVYVADRGNSRVQKFDSSGNYVAQWRAPSWMRASLNPSWIAVGANGSVFTGGSRGDVIEFSSAGDYVGRFGRYGTAEGRFDRMAGLAVDSSGNVYVCDTGNNRVQRFVPSAE